MNCSNNVGILLSSQLLHRIRAGFATREQAKLYFQFGKRLGLQPVLFDLRGLDLTNRRIRGYVWHPTSRSYIPVHRPLPPVVHSRVLGYSPKLTRLSQIMGKRLFNPPIRREKVFIHRLLSRNPTVRTHLPAMIPLTETTKAVAWIDKYPVVFIKPVIGSLGQNIIRIENMGKGSFLVHPYIGKRTRMSTSGLARYLGTLKQRRYYLVQQGIPLARFNGAPFDFRVSVQKGRFGRWEISGIAAKVARKQSHMTNIAQNGKAMRAWTVLNRCFPKQRIQAILHRISHLSIATCQELEKTWPAFADAGLDVGVDQKGRPWLIEVNFRDLRIIFPLAGDKKMFQRTYLNPLLYAAFLRH
ncbi:hypothetical protein JIR001_10160 [Polycladomyces abyssicola]|uniref:YheC/YheD family protein n=1 Tax=Polycladomyces abyssicola TaxID=1125966 RepID=A0A8D5UFE0_9BACL|nr:YheC/YheD family protein [Polycladomyces abyssicola]BCU81233.1 hypothetical protein JIR001_10160 [Polycladomyces abyssicola]